MPDTLADECRRARDAQQRWAAVALRERLTCVRRLRHVLARDARELALTATLDVERPAAEVLATDVLPTADALWFLERNARRILGRRHLGRRVRPVWLFGGREHINRVPWGVVGIIGTWNYPILLNVVPIVQALVAGNAVLWKPSELTPTVARKITALCVEAGFPEHLLTTLPATRDAGPELLDADIDHLVFTGSERAGRQIAVRLAERLIPSTLELSGCDAMIVLEDADIDLAAKAVWHGATLNCGQTCLAVRRVLVERPVYEAMLEALRRHAPEARPEPLALWSQAEQAERLVREALGQGAKRLESGSEMGGSRSRVFTPPNPPLAKGGNQTSIADTSTEFRDRDSLSPRDAFLPKAEAVPFPPLSGGGLAGGTAHEDPSPPPAAENDPPRYPPTLVFDATPQMAICQEASFAPIAAVTPFTDFADGHSQWQASPFQLSASVFTKDARKLEQWLAVLTVSTVVVNDVIMPTVHPAVAFGGRRSAGWGVTRGEEGLLAMTTPQAVLTRFGRFRPHYDGPDAPGVGEVLNGLLQWKHSERRGDRWSGFWRMVKGAWKAK